MTHGQGGQTDLGRAGACSWRGAGGGRAAAAGSAARAVRGAAASAFAGKGRGDGGRAARVGTGPGGGRPGCGTRCAAAGGRWRWAGRTSGSAARPAAERAARGRAAPRPSAAFPPRGRAAARPAAGAGSAPPAAGRAATAVVASAPTVQPRRRGRAAAGRTLPGLVRPDGKDERPPAALMFRGAVRRSSGVLIPLRLGPRQGLEAGARPADTGIGRRCRVHRQTTGASPPRSGSRGGAYPQVHALPRAEVHWASGHRWPSAKLPVITSLTQAGPGSQRAEETVSRRRRPFSGAPSLTRTLPALSWHPVAEGPSPA